MDLVRFLAHDEASGETLVITLPTKTPGLRVEKTWDTTGMRATVSHDVVLEDVAVPDAAVAAKLPAGAPIRTPIFANIARWFLPLAASVYVGVAEEARAEALRSLGKARNSNSRDAALTDALIGEMETAYVTAVAVRDHVTRSIDPKPDDMEPVLPLAIAGKDAIVNNCILAVEKAVQIAGGGAYFKRSPLERLARDVRAARFHPPAAPVSMQIVGERVREAAERTAAAV
jgi:acyl-CoA dehydrogenase